MAATGIEIAAILKGVGAFAGAMMSFAFAPAFTFKTIVLRLGIAAFLGYLLADPAIIWLKLEERSIEHPTLVGGVLAGFFIWFILNAAVRLIQTSEWTNIPWPFKKK